MNRRSFLKGISSAIVSSYLCLKGFSEQTQLPVEKIEDISLRSKWSVTYNSTICIVEDEFSGKCIFASPNPHNEMTSQSSHDTLFAEELDHGYILYNHDYSSQYHISKGSGEMAIRTKEGKWITQ